jgi:multidrug efflux pump subunit AcrB
MSSSAEGLSMIDVEFMPDVPTDVALQRVRDRVDLARGELPDDVMEPVIKEINLAEFPSCRSVLPATSRRATQRDRKPDAG